jgi:hypothetical protein
MKKLLSLVVAIVTLGSGFTQAASDPCNSENSSDCAVQAYQAVYCPDVCQTLKDQADILAPIVMTACLQPASPACASATAAATALSVALGVCEAANATAYGIKYAACELGSL